MKAIPEELASEADNVAVVVEGHAEGRPLFGLYQGIPLTNRMNYSGAIPDRITLYQDTISEYCNSEEELVAQITQTVIHEFAHHFGIGDAQLKQMGWAGALHPRLREGLNQPAGGPDFLDAPSKVPPEESPALGYVEAPRSDTLPVADAPGTILVPPGRDLYVPERGLEAIPLYDNVHVVARALVDDEDWTVNLDRFDEPERDRMYQLALQFVSHHVRSVRSPGLRTRDRSFPGGAVIVSEKSIPRIPFRRIRVNWAIGSGHVSEVHDHRLFVFRTSKIEIPPRQRIWAPGHGDRHDLAYLLGNVCAVLKVHVPDPVGATGVVALNTNNVLSGDELEGVREAAARDNLTHLVLPATAGLMPGEHGKVRYWPCRDVNEALFSFFSIAARETLVPDLRRRWLVKMAWSWVSLLAILAAFLMSPVWSTGGYVGSRTLSWVFIGVAVALFAVSSYATHRYWKTDR